MANPHYDDDPVSLAGASRGKRRGHLCDGIDVPKRVCGGVGASVFADTEEHASATTVSARIVHAPAFDKVRLAVETGDASHFQSLRPPTAEEMSDDELIALLRYELQMFEGKMEIQQTPFYEFMLLVAQKTNSQPSRVITSQRRPWRSPPARDGGAQCADGRRRDVPVTPLATHRGVGGVGAFGTPTGGAVAPSAQTRDEMRTQERIADARRWLEQPYIIGLLDIDPAFRGAINGAYARVRQEAWALGALPIELFWESEQVRNDFARVVAAQVTMARVLAPTRQHLEVEKGRIDAEASKAMFALATYYSYERRAGAIIDRRVPQQTPPMRDAPVPQAWMTRPTFYVTGGARRLKMSPYA